MIPHTIHQMYKTANNLPAYFQPQWMQSWKDNHPTWTYQFWTDADLRKLAADKYPDHLPVFDQPQTFPGIMRGDLGRLMVLDQFGGVYADLDYASLKPLDPLLVEGRNLIGAAMPTDLKVGIVPQAFLASTPGHPIFKEVMAYGLGMYVGKNIAYVPGSYGWYSFSGIYRKYQANPDVYTAPPKELCPFSWMPSNYANVHNERYLSLDELRQAHPDAYAIHFWETGWGPNRRKRLDQDEQTPPFPPANPNITVDPIIPLGVIGPVKNPGEWPQWAQVVKKLSSKEDKGVGDTVARFLGKGSDWFPRWYKKMTGADCGCARRHAEWNQLYPYTENFGPKP